jgi:chemotaxis protein MotB
MPIKKSEVEEIGRPSPAWMTSYSDLVTQLLTFFIMLFALSSATTEDQLKKIKQKIDNYVTENKLEKFVSTKITLKEGLVITFSEKYMFDPGKADIYNEAKEVIKNIAQLLVDEPNRISIEGHTDNTPISTPEFPSNWELSTARATRILRYLLEELKFEPKRLTAAGFGEWHPVVDNDTPENRAKNRRVDIIVRRMDLDEMRVWKQKLAAAARSVINQ